MSPQDPLEQLLQELLQVLPQVLPQAFRENLYDLCNKWANFSYDVVTEVHDYGRNGEEEGVHYVHDWVEPPTRSFYDYLVEDFIPWFIEARNAYNPLVIAQDNIINYISESYRLRCCRAGEHHDVTRTNPRNDGSVDRTEHMSFRDRFAIHRTLSGVDPRRDLTHTRYWLL